MQLKKSQKLLAGELIRVPPQKLYPQGFDGAPHRFCAGGGVAGACVGACGGGLAVGRAGAGVGVVGTAVGDGVATDKVEEVEEAEDRTEVVMGDDELPHPMRVAAAAIAIEASSGLMDLEAS